MTPCGQTIESEPLTTVLHHNKLEVLEASNHSWLLAFRIVGVVSGTQPCNWCTLVLSESVGAHLIAEVIVFLSSTKENVFPSTSWPPLALHIQPEGSISIKLF